MSGNQLIISNFRSWRERNYIDFASINLLLGSNSSGKSSIIHALSLLKQSKLSCRLIPKGNEIDLGRIEDQINFKSKSKSKRKRNLSDYLGFGLKLQIKPSDLSHRNDFRVYNNYTRREVLSRANFDKQNNDLAALIGDVEYIEHYDDLGFIKNISITSRNLEILTISFKKNPSSKIFASIKVTNNPEYWEQFIDLTGESEVKYWNAEREQEDTQSLVDLKKRLETLDSETLDNEIADLKFDGAKTKKKKFNAKNDKIRLNYNREQFFLKRQITMLEKRLTRKILPGDSIEEKCSFISDKLSQKLELTIEDLEARSISDLILGTVNTISDRPHLLNNKKKIDKHRNSIIEIKDTIELLDANSKSLKTIHPYIMLAIVQDRFSEVTKSVVRIGPHRERPDRVTFVNPNEKSTFVGTQGENVMSIINQSTDSEIEVLNEWIEKLGIPYKITRNFIEEFNISLAILTDEEGMSVSLADVGYGISQVLPIVLESILRQNTIIAIEQPELHLHPKLQANLADLFIKSAEICNNNFILETHSEHIILRLKRRQKEAREDFVMTELDYKKSKSHKNNSNNAKIENQRNKGLETWVSIRDSVVITVIDTPKNKSESEFSRITLNSDGDFDSLWPGDFFPERYKELGLEDDF